MKDKIWELITILAVLGILIFVGVLAVEGKIWLIKQI